MKRFVILSSVLFTILLSGCSSQYVLKNGTPTEELQANVSASEDAKQERLK